MAFGIILIVFFGLALSKQSEINSYKNNNDIFFSGNIIAFKQIRTIEYAVLIDYDSIKLEYLKGDKRIHIGIIDTVKKKIAFIAFVKPPFEHNSHYGIPLNKFADYVKVDLATNQILFLKENKTYFETNEVSVLGNFEPSIIEFQEFYLTHDLNNIVKF